MRKVAGLKIMPWRAVLAGAALLVLLGACSNPAGPPDPGKEEPETPVPLGPGLYSFAGDSPPRETGEGVVKIPTLPFTLANALAVIDAEIEDPPEDPEPGTLPPQKNYLVVVDRDTLLQSWALQGSFSLTIRGLETERVIQLYNAGANEEVEEKNYESLFYIGAGASLTLEENITLVGSLANSAPLVSVGALGSFALRDRTKIQNNSAGGVRVQGRQAQFTMHGGEISSCTLFNYYSDTQRRSSPGGAGVQILDGGSFVMKGGVIRNNRFEQTEGTQHFTYGGGGVYRDSAAGPFVMEGGEITGNYSYRNGGGVFGDFTMSGGTIRWNTCDDPNPLHKNLYNSPAAEGEAFVVEGWNEPHELVLSEKGDAPDKPVAEVETGSRLEFSAAVAGIGTPSQSVNWSILETHNPYTTVTDGVLVVSPGETAPVLTVRAASAVDPAVLNERAVTIRVYDERRLWVKFELRSPDRATELFNALHGYIQSGQLDRGNPRGVRVGDYYDLPRLSVASDGVAAAVSGNNTFMDDGAGLFRLLIVGINTFEGINGNTGSHIVFQFRNAVVSRRMNAGGPGSYADSEMRTYLTDYFLPGLIDAGVPQDVLWNPVRLVAKGSNDTGTDTLDDYLWLPTALEVDALRLNELLGHSRNNTNLLREGETRENQALLDYYAAAADVESAASLLNRRDRDGKSAITFWLASPGPKLYSSDVFAVFESDYTSRFEPNFDRAAGTAKHGVIPAFCVK
jgi:hypothetical protein